MRPGRHGSMSSGELEGILTRNANFLSVRRTGSSVGHAGLYHSVTGEYIAGIGGGELPEYSRNLVRKWGCECNPTGLCPTGEHGIGLIRGWRNIMFEIACKGHLRITNEIVRVLGEEMATDAIAKLMAKRPKTDPAVAWTYSSLRSAS